MVTINQGFDTYNLIDEAVSNQKQKRKTAFPENKKSAFQSRKAFALSLVKKGGAKGFAAYFLITGTRDTSTNTKGGGYL